MMIMAILSFHHAFITLNSLLIKDNFNFHQKTRSEWKIVKDTYIDL